MNIVVTSSPQSLEGGEEGCRGEGLGKAESARMGSARELPHLQLGSLRVKSPLQWIERHIVLKTRTVK